MDLDLMNLPKGLICYQLRVKKKKISYHKIILENVKIGDIVSSYEFRRSDKKKPSIFIAVTNYSSEKLFKHKKIFFSKKDLFLECHEKYFDVLSSSLEHEIQTFIKKHPQYFI